MIRPDSKVAIFVDSLDPLKRRYSYWDGYLSRQGVVPKYISIPELAIEAGKVFSAKEANVSTDEVQRRQPRLDGYDVIILNWDVANGDFAFGADLTLNYFETRGRDEIVRWANGGARIVIEIQATAGFPSQQCYDAILGAGSVRVSPYGRVRSWEDKAETVLINRRRRKHPLNREIHGHYDSLTSVYQPFEHIVFPRFDKTNESSFARNPSAYSWGNFVSWERGWIPLMMRQGRWPANLSFKERCEALIFGRPVALTRSVGALGGEIVVTTMRIPNAAPDDVIDAFVEFSPAIKERTARYFRSEERLRNLLRSALIVGIWFVGVLIVFPMLNYYFDRVNADLELWIKQVALDLSRSGWNQPGSWLKTFGAKIKVFDIAAFAVALSLVGASRWIWYDRDRR
tara:strand:+ start:1665 stop:2864 length:1200 start_codon:yes stop_codon:yes gene_type:complete